VIGLRQVDGMAYTNRLELTSLNGQALVAGESLPVGQLLFVSLGIVIVYLVKGLAGVRESYAIAFALGLMFMWAYILVGQTWFFLAPAVILVTVAVSGTMLDEYRTNKKRGLGRHAHRKRRRRNKRRPNDTSR
jgi:hypothetical protein